MSHNCIAKFRRLSDRINITEDRLSEHVAEYEATVGKMLDATSPSCDENLRSQVTRLTQDNQSLDELVKARDKQIAELREEVAALGHLYDEQVTDNTRLAKELDCARSNLSGTMTELSAVRCKLSEWRETAESKMKAILAAQEALRQ